jgi:hypothetical protein
MIVIGLGPFCLLVVAVGIVMYVRFRDRAPRCPACRNIVPGGAVRCPHCTSGITSTFSLLDERNAQAALPAVNEDRSTFWRLLIILGAAAVGGVLVVGAVVWYSERTDLAATERPRLVQASTPALPAPAPLAVEPRFDAQAASRARERDQKRTDSLASNAAHTASPPPAETPTQPARPRGKPAPHPPQSAGDALAIMGARQRARYDEQARLAAQGAVAAQEVRKEAPRAAEPGHRVVLLDGTTLWAKNVPRLSGNSVVFTDAQNRLVSLRASEVDLKATGAANDVVLERTAPHDPGL